MEKARYNTELYSNLRVPINNVKPSNFRGSHQLVHRLECVIYRVVIASDYFLASLFFLRASTK